MDGSHSAPYLDLYIGVGLLASDHSVAGDVAFDPAKEHLYLLTGPRVGSLVHDICLKHDMH